MELNMPKRKGYSDETPVENLSWDPEEHEKQMISLAMSCAERQLRDGTASPAVVVHFLKRTDPEEKKKIEKLENEIKLLQAKIEAYESSKRIEDTYRAALDAMRSYRSDNE